MHFGGYWYAYLLLVLFLTYPYWIFICNFESISAAMMNMMFVPVHVMLLEFEFKFMPMLYLNARYDSNYFPRKKQNLGIVAMLAAQTVSL